MYREHCEYEYAVMCHIITDNYGISTTPVVEWKAVCGGWTPANKDFALPAGFSCPQETKNVNDCSDGRIVICLADFFNPSPAEVAMWMATEGSAEREDAHVGTRAEREARVGRRMVWKAGLTHEECAAVRLWSGPTFAEYNRVLRGFDVSMKGCYTTTLHALCSAAYKLSQIGTPEVVYRGLGGRAISTADFSKGAFVERGAQSLTR